MREREGGVGMVEACGEVGVHKDGRGRCYQMDSGRRVMVMGL